MPCSASQDECKKGTPTGYRIAIVPRDFLSRSRHWVLEKPEEQAGTFTIGGKAVRWRIWLLEATNAAHGLKLKPSDYQDDSEGTGDQQINWGEFNAGKSQAVGTGQSNATADHGLGEDSTGIALAEG